MNHFGTSICNETELGNLFPVCYVSNSEKVADGINYLKRKVTSIRKDEMDIMNYSYNKDYAREFPTFLGDTLNG